MAENEVQQENPKDNSAEARKKRQLEMLDKAPLGTYWKQTWKEGRGLKGPRTDEYCFITNLEHSKVGGGPYLKGERLQIAEGSSYSFDDRATLYGFSFDKERNAYYEQISQEEYEGLRNKTIKIYENKSSEWSNRRTLFAGFIKERGVHLDYNKLMELVIDRYNSIKDYIDDANRAEELCKEKGETEFLKEIQERRELLRKESLIRVYSSWSKTEYPNIIRRFNIHEIDITSISFEPAKFNDKGTVYVGGTPFENNGKNFHFKIRSYGQSLGVEKMTRDYYDSNVSVSFNSVGKTWREDDSEGWKTYISKNDEYTKGEYKNTPSWNGDEFYLINDWEFNQLIDLIKHTGLEETA